MAEGAARQQRTEMLARLYGGKLRLERRNGAPKIYACTYLQGKNIVKTTCRSRIRSQAATGSWTRPRQWETQRTWFRSAEATVCPPAKVNGVWPSNDA